MRGIGGSILLGDLPEDIVESILRCATRRTGSPVLGLVSRHFKALLPRAMATLRVPYRTLAPPDCITGALRAYRNLETVALEEGACADISDEVLACLPRVRQLSIFFTEDDSASEDRLKSLLQESTRLVHLELRDWSGGPVLESIAGLPHLRSLSLEGDELQEGLQGVLESVGPALRNLELRGVSLEVPQNMSMLSQLRSLSLECTDLSGPVAALSRLTALTNLSLIVDYMTRLECNLNPLTRLRTLNLGHTPLRALPEGLGDLSSLKSLSLRCSTTSEDGYSAVGRLQGLTSLFIETFRCRPGPLLGLLEGMSGLTALHQLTLHCTALPRGGAEMLSRLPALVHLRLHWNKAADALEPSGTPDAPDVPDAGSGYLPRSLQVLELEGPQPVRILAHLTELTWLRQLRIDVDRACRQSLREADPLHRVPRLAAFQLSQLQVLELCSFEGLLAAPLGGLKSLKSLALKRCPSLRGLPAELSTLGALEELSLLGCGSENECFEVPDVFAGLTALQTVTLVCPGLRAIPASLPALGSLRCLTVSAKMRAHPEAFHSSCKLRELTCERCPSLRTLPKSLANLSALEELSITECRSMRRNPKVAFQLRGLRSLEIGRCPIRRLPQEIGNLQSLNRLSLNLKLRSLPASLSKCQALKDVSLASCRMRKLPTVLTSLPELQSLEVEGWPRLSAVPVCLAHVTSLTDLYFFSCPRLNKVPRQLLDLPRLAKLAKDNLADDFNLV